MLIRYSMDKQLIEREVSYRTSRSGGPGGQHVNKTETKVELVFDLVTSAGLTEEEKALLRVNIANHLTKDEKLIIASSTHRSQLANKKECFARFIRLLDEGTTVKAERIATKPSKTVREKRMKRKNERSEVKQARRWRFED